MICQAAVIAAMLAAAMNRPADLIAEVYWMSGLEGVAVVEYESQFNPRAYRREAAGGTSWGLWQLWDKCHKQYRDNLLLHCGTGASFWKACLRSGGTVERGYSLYNSGSPWRSIEKGKCVERKYNSLRMYLWRRMR
jgi:hypothetical protein